jgi:hypothetical protein
MWLYQLNGQLRKGMPVTLKPGDPRVVIGSELATGKRLVLPLGTSLERLLVCDEADLQSRMLLERADLQETNAGMVLCHQSREEAVEDARALVAIDFPLQDVAEGEWVEHRRFGGRAMPQLLEDRLMVFCPGEGIETAYRSKIVPTWMRLSWNGRTLECRYVRQERRPRA